MSPLRWDVLLVGLVLAVPVLALGLRGDFTIEEVTSRLPWCLVAGWLVVALVRYVSTPRATPADRARPTAEPERATESEPAPAP